MAVDNKKPPGSNSPDAGDFYSAGYDCESAPDTERPDCNLAVRPAVYLRSPGNLQTTFGDAIGGKAGVEMAELPMAELYTGLVAIIKTGGGDSKVLQGAKGDDANRDV